MRNGLAALSVFCASVLGGSAGVAGPTVLELYTSQGCSSCPPADQMMLEMAERDDVIALSLHVDYWDYLGWVDDLAKSQYTRRQRGLTDAAGARTIYTPQIVIGGVEHVIGSRPVQVMDALMAHAKVVDPVEIDVSRSGNRVSIVAAANGIEGEALVQIVRFWPEVVRNISRGENAGRSITYANVVYAWDAVATWNVAQPLALEAQIDGDDPVVVIVQDGPHGAILGAAIIRE